MPHPPEDPLPPGALPVGYGPGTKEEQKERLRKRWGCDDVEKQNYKGVGYWVPCQRQDNSDKEDGKTTKDTKKKNKK